MVVYLISYDLVAPGKDYKTLYSALGALGAQKVLLSQWVVRVHNTSAAALRDDLRQYMDANDRILVNGLGGHNWASWNVLVDINTI